MEFKIQYESSTDYHLPTTNPTTHYRLPTSLNIPKTLLRHSNKTFQLTYKSDSTITDISHSYIGLWYHCVITVISLWHHCDIYGMWWDVDRWQTGMSETDLKLTGMLFLDGDALVNFWKTISKCTFIQNESVQL